MAAQKNTEGLAFLVDALKKDKNVVYADAKAAAEKKGLTVWPIMFGKAKAILGIVKSAKRGTGKAAMASAAKAGRTVDGSSKSDQVRALLATGMSPAEIAKQVGCRVGLVYNVKSKSGGAKAQRGPGRPPEAAASGPRRGPGRPRKPSVAGLDGVGEIVAMVKASQADLGRFRGALEKIQTVIAGVLK